MKTLNVGTIIKSLDFPGRDDCYMIGRIIEIDLVECIYECELIKAVSVGEEFTDKLSFKTFTTVFNGGFDDLFENGRIQAIG